MKTTKQPWWVLTSEDSAQELATDLEFGLSEEEAQKRLGRYGPNKIIEQTGLSAFKIFFRQFFSGIILILLGSCVIAALLGAWVDMFTIAAIVFLNALIGFFQEYSAERSLQALRSLSKPQAHVIRDGEPVAISAADLVPGDIVLLQAGDRIPADGRLVLASGLGVDESALTGESVPVAKQQAALTDATVAIADRTNMVFMGTLVVKGSGTFLVTETGSATQFGAIAKYIANAPELETSIQKQLKHVGTMLIVTSCAIALAISVIGLMKGVSLLVLLFISLSLFIAAVPEGLPAVITVALARAVKRMAKRHALIRRLASVESLGSINYICTDKTGTITQNRMTVTTLATIRAEFSVTGTGGDQVGQFLKQEEPIDLTQEDALNKLLTIGVLCNNAELDEVNGAWQVLGDPTEGALLIAASKVGITKDDLEVKHPLHSEYPFTSERKRMSMLRHIQDGLRLYIKGACDSILDRSTRILDGTTIRPLTEEDRQKIHTLNETYARNALRVIAGAYRDGPFTFTEDDEENLIFVGLFAMIDPPREEVKEALMQAKRAGIETRMLTGDHKHTARAIGLEVGLMAEGDTVLTGQELNDLTDHELLKALRSVPVYARISVEHKIRIVRVLQEAGERVAMTGDGVNDAPALKTADIGIAMGMAGTDVAKEAADMIITDDNYASIVHAIEEGRGMYESLVKFVRYLLSSNLAEVLVVFWGVLVSSFLAEQPFIVLLPVQLLWVNLISDGLPAIALVFDPLHTGLMQKKPEDFQTSLVTLHSITHLFGVGVILSLGVLASYFFGLFYSLEIAQTMAFTSLVVLEFVRLYSVRAEYHVPFFSNRLVIIALVGSLMLQGLLIYVPSLQAIFKTTPLNGIHWSFIFMSTFVTWVTYRLFRKVFP